MANYRFESGPRQYLEKSRLVGETKKTYVWTDPNNQNSVVKIRKQRYLRLFNSPDEAISKICNRVSERMELVGSLQNLGAKHPEELVVPETYVIYPLRDEKFEYDIEQPRIFGKTLDDLRIKILEESPEILREVGKIIQIQLILLKQHKTMGLYGTRWPNQYSRLELLFRPFFPILFSKNIMIGQGNSEERLPWLVDLDILSLDHSDSKSIKTRKNILIGSYISLLLIKAKVGKIQ